MAVWSQLQSYPGGEGTDEKKGTGFKQQRLRSVAGFAPRRFGPVHCVQGLPERRGVRQGGWRTGYDQPGYREVPAGLPGGPERRARTALAL